MSVIRTSTVPDGSMAITRSAPSIFALAMEPQLVSIAGVYRTVDAPLAADIWSRPAQVRLADDRLQIDAL